MLAPSRALTHFQATILATRPILLHLAKLKYEQDNGKATNAAAPQLVKLSDTCTEAADRTLRVLFALKEQQLLGRSCLGLASAIASR